MLPLLSLIPGVGQILGNIAGGRAEGRLTEAELGQNADRIALDRARLNQDQNDSSIGLDLDQRRYADESNDRSQRTALLGSLLSGLQDYQVQLPPELEPYRVQSSGGLMPSSFTGRDEIARLITERALSELENPLEAGGIGREAAAPAAPAAERPLNKVERRTGRQQAAAPPSDIGMSDAIAQTTGRRLPQINLANLPSATPMPQAGLLDKILSGLSMGSSIYGAATGGGGSTQGARVTPPNTPSGVMRGVTF